MTATGTRSWCKRGPWRDFLRRATNRHDRARCLPVTLALFLSLFLPPPLPAEDSSKTYETRYAVINYAEIKDLYTFTRNISSGLGFLWGNPEKDPLMAKTQVDKIVESICSILDMYPPNFRFSIILYKTQAEVSAAYKAQGIAGDAPVAFYYHRTRSIAVAVDTIADNILAHEIAHAVICAHFVIPPPARMQEILCQYMDKHFRDK